MRYSIRTVTPATAPLLSLDEAKKHLEVDFDRDDALIEAFVAAAQDHVERHTSRILTPRELEFSCSGFPCGIGRNGAFLIPRDPITAVSAIAYTDTTGATIELAEADWRWSESAPDQVLAAFNGSWPAAAAEAGSVRITFEAGYEAGLCPPALAQAVRLLVGTFYSQREGVVSGVSVAELPGGVAALCAPYRRISI